MSRIQSSLRATIARNIRNCRLEKFPGCGGSKACAAKISRYTGKHISPSQWSSWESGGRTPNEESLQQIAAFFEKTVEYMVTNRISTSIIPDVQSYEPAGSSYVGMSAPELIMVMGRSRMKAVYEVMISIASVKFIPCHEPSDQ